MPSIRPTERIWIQFFALSFGMSLPIIFYFSILIRKIGFTGWMDVASTLLTEFITWTPILTSFSLYPFFIIIVAATASLFIHDFIKKLFRQRYDIWLCAILGSLSATALLYNFNDTLFGGHGNYGTPLIDHTSEFWNIVIYAPLILISLPILKSCDYLISAITSRPKGKSKKKIQGNGAQTLSESPISSIEDDEFTWGKKVKHFSNAVVTAPEDVVFGVEAPWGAGKTSFINLCEKEWNKSSDFKIIIHRFELLRYVGSSSLIQHFVLSLLEKLQKHYYLPELRLAVNGYLAGLQGSLEIGAAPFVVSISSHQPSIEETLETIEEQLERRLPENARVIVVIDDLDRVEPQSARDLLFALHKCFSLPRLKYVICYDQKQLNQKAELHRDNGGDLASQTLHDFIDKFVTARVYLTTTPEGISKYIDKLKNSNESDSEVGKKEFIKQILGENGLSKLVKTGDVKDFVRYQLQDNKQSQEGESNETKEHVFWRLIGNVRQVKRLYNQISLCWEKGLDTNMYDFENIDLILLLLIQSHYPDLFRKLHQFSNTGEFLFLTLEKKEVSPEPMSNSLNEFITNASKELHPNSQDSENVEVLLGHMLFFKSRTNANQNKQIRYRDNFRRYFEFLTKEQSPPLLEQEQYYHYLYDRFKQDGNLTQILENEGVTGNVTNSKLKWEDKHKIKLWSILLSHYIHLPQFLQRRKLLAGLLDAVPKFPSTSHNDNINYRKEAVNLFTEMILTIAHEPTEVKKAIKFIWLSHEKGLMSKKDFNQSLLAWDHAITMLEDIAYKDTAIGIECKVWMRQLFWLKFKRDYPTLQYQSVDELGALEIEDKHSGQKNSQEAESQNNFYPRTPPSKAPLNDGNHHTTSSGLILPKNPNSGLPLTSKQWLCTHWKRLFHLTYSIPKMDNDIISLNELNGRLRNNFLNYNNPSNLHIHFWIILCKNSKFAPLDRSRHILREYYLMHKEKIEIALHQEDLPEEMKPSQSAIEELINE